MPAGGGELTFWTSYDTEADWDYLTVEARTAGRQRLDDAAGRQRAHEPDTGESCPSGWRRAAPAARRTTRRSTPTATCTPTGTTRGVERRVGQLGRLAAVVGRPRRLRRQTVEISIAYISDWGTQNLGVFLDDFALPDGATTSFEGADTGGWTVTGPPPGSGPNANNWTITDAGGFPVGASITTPHSLLDGLRVRGDRTQGERNAVMGRVLSHLLG